MYNTFTIARSLGLEVAGGRSFSRKESLRVAGVPRRAKGVLEEGHGVHADESRGSEQFREV